MVWQRSRSAFQNLLFHKLSIYFLVTRWKTAVYFPAVLLKHYCFDDKRAERGNQGTISKSRTDGVIWKPQTSISVVHPVHRNGAKGRNNHGFCRGKTCLGNCWDPPSLLELFKAHLDPGSPRTLVQAGSASSGQLDRQSSHIPSDLNNYLIVYSLTDEKNAWMLYSN